MNLLFLLFSPFTEIIFSIQQFFNDKFEVRINSLFLLKNSFCHVNTIYFILKKSWFLSLKMYSIVLQWAALFSDDIFSEILTGFISEKWRVFCLENIRKMSKEKFYKIIWKFLKKRDINHTRDDTSILFFWECIEYSYHHNWMKLEIVMN